MLNSRLHMAVLAVALAITSLPGHGAGSEPTPKTLQLQKIGGFEHKTPDNKPALAEIPAYDPLSKRLVVVNGTTSSVDVLSLADPTQPKIQTDPSASFGGRSFSIWDSNINLIWDSGEQLEQITAAEAARNGASFKFNSSNSNHTEKSRSVAKGPEPEGVVIGKFGDVPAPLPPVPPVVWSPALRRRFDVALGRLDAVTALLPNAALLLYSFVRKEAVLSSQIEGTQSSLADLLLYEIRS